MHIWWVFFFESEDYDMLLLVFTVGGCVENTLVLYTVNELLLILSQSLLYSLGKQFSEESLSTYLLKTQLRGVLGDKFYQ